MPFSQCPTAWVIESDDENETFGSTELKSLHRQIGFLSKEVARVERDRDKQLNQKELVIIKKNASNEKTQKAFSKLKADHYQLKETARILREQARADDHRSAQLKNEIKVLCAEIDAAKRRIKELEEALTTIPSAQLRLKIKLLCVKYHPDHGQTMLSSAEVARDLIELLSD